MCADLNGNGVGWSSRLALCAELDCLPAMSGKIAHLSNQQTSDFRKQFRRGTSQSGSQSGRHPGSQSVSSRGRSLRRCFLVVVSVVSPTRIRSSCLVPFELFVHVNCFCRVAEAIEKFNTKKNENRKKPKNSELALDMCPVMVF